MQKAESKPLCDLEIKFLHKIFDFALETYQTECFRVYEEQMSSIKNHLWITSLIITAQISLVLETQATEVTNLWLTLFSIFNVIICFIAIGLALWIIKSDSYYVPVNDFTADFDYIEKTEGPYTIEKEKALLGHWIKGLDKGHQMAGESSNRRATFLNIINTCIYAALTTLALSISIVLFS